MLKELIAIGMSTTLMTAPPQNTNDGTYYQDVNITETYEYETNEVNSGSDLVVGNIYHFEFNGLLDNVALIEIGNTYIYNLNTNSTTYAYWNPSTQAGHIRLTDTKLYLIYDMLEVSLKNAITDNVDLTTFTLEYDFVYDDTYNLSNSAYLYISASDYLGEKTITVEPVETEGLYNLAYHFLYSRIYTNTELQGMETTLFGTTINMNMWLSHTTAIVIICLLLIVLIKLVIWLFKIVSGGMLWK